MNFLIESTPAFDRAIKRLLKKYHRIKFDLVALITLLTENPYAGTAIPGYAHEVWKIRLASTDMKVGKRSGYRVIYAIDTRRSRCYLLYIYAKTDRTNITPAEIEALLAELE